MATTVARLQAVLSANTRDFDRAMHTSEGRLKSIGKTAGLAVGAAGLGAIAITLRAGIKEWTESTKVTAQTNAVIKSTGGVAGITAKHVDKLASSMLKKTGIDDEAIRTSENLLLGFTHLRNEVGKGNDVFDRATKIVQDYSVRTGKSATMASIAFGKALNDPVKGMGALGRAGIVLTDAQKKTIKGFVDAGTPIKAQTYLLSLLETRFGGAAEAAGKTLPGQIAIARESFKNFAGDLIARMIPVLEQVVAWVRDHWPEISAKFQEGWAIIKPILVALGQLVVSIVQLIRKHWGTIGPIVAGVVNVIRTELQVVAGIIKFFAAVLNGDWSAAWAALKGVVSKAVEAVKAYLRLERDVVVAIVKGIGTASWQALSAAFNAAWEGVKKAVSGLFHKIVDWIKDFLGIKSPSTVFHGIGVNMIKGLISGIGSMGGALKNYVVNTVKHLPGAVLGVFKGGAGKADDYIGGLTSRVAYAVNFAQQHGWRGQVTSGYRSYAEQAQLYARYVNSGYNPRYIAAKPGTSSHESGQAVDVTDIAGFARAMSMLPLSARLFSRVVGDPVHFSVSGYAKGGIINKPTLALMGEAGPEAVVPLGKSGGWQKRTLDFMSRVWAIAAPFYGQGGKPMPGVSFSNESTRGMPAFVKDGKLVWPRSVSNALFGASGGMVQWAMNALLHEWAHIFQLKSIIGTKGYLSDPARAEGGAAAFVKLLGRRIYQGLGMNYTGSPVDYFPEMQYALQTFGPDWVRLFQFGLGRTATRAKSKSFDRGGFLSPGLTLAYNGTGRPEPVGGGNITIPVSIGGEHVATVVFDMLRRRARVFEGRNGRAAFG